MTEIKLEEKVIIKEKEKIAVYELGGDLFFCEFSLEQFKEENKEELKKSILEAGREVAKEYKML